MVVLQPSPRIRVGRRRYNPEVEGLGGMMSSLSDMAQISLGVATMGFLNTPKTGLTQSGAAPQYIVQGTNEVRSPHYVSGPSFNQSQAAPVQAAFAQYQTSYTPLPGQMSYMPSGIDSYSWLFWGAGGIAALGILYLITRG